MHKINEFSVGDAVSGWTAEKEAAYTAEVACIHDNHLYLKNHKTLPGGREIFWAGGRDCFERGGSWVCKERSDGVVMSDADMGEPLVLINKIDLITSRK